MEKKEVANKFFSTIAWATVSFLFTSWLLKPTNAFIKKGIESLDLSWLTPNEHNAQINILPEGNAAIVKHYSGKIATAISHTQGYINPFTEAAELINYQIPIGTTLALSGKFTKHKGITYAETRLPTGQIIHININTLKV